MDMNEVMGLRQAAEALKPDAPAGGDGGAVKKGKGGQLSDVREASEEMEPWASEPSGCVEGFLVGEQNGTEYLLE